MGVSELSGFTLKTHQKKRVTSLAIKRFLFWLGPFGLSVAILAQLVYRHGASLFSRAYHQQEEPIQEEHEKKETNISEAAAALKKEKNISEASAALDPWC